MSALWEIEDAVHDEGYETVCGVDEAGRGPLAGPVCAAAVILPRDIEIPGLNDSKKLTAKKREELYGEITATAVAYGIAFADVAENRAVGRLGIGIDLALIDGNRSEGIEYPCRTVVKGDSRCASIAAASILAKVTRDRYMCALAEKYPGYGFETHKGYGTKAHYAAIHELGVCPEHRPSFLKKMH